MGRAEQNKEVLLSHTLQLTPEPADLFALAEGLQSSTSGSRNNPALRWNPAALAELEQISQCQQQVSKCMVKPHQLELSKCPSEN